MLSLHHSAQSAAVSRSHGPLFGHVFACLPTRSESVFACISRCRSKLLDVQQLYGISHEGGHGHADAHSQSEHDGGCCDGGHKEDGLRRLRPWRDRPRQGGQSYPKVADQLLAEDKLQTRRTCYWPPLSSWTWFLCRGRKGVSCLPRPNNVAGRYPQHFCHRQGLLGGAT